MLNLYAASPNKPFAVDPYTVALWHFDENMGDSAYDASGHGNSGKLYGAQWVQGVFGSALQFDGTDAGKRFIEAWKRARIIVDTSGGHSGTPPTPPTPPATPGK